MLKISKLFLNNTSWQPLFAFARKKRIQASQDASSDNYDDLFKIADNFRLQSEQLSPHLENILIKPIPLIQNIDLRASSTNSKDISKKDQALNLIQLKQCYEQNQERQCDYILAQERQRLILKFIEQVHGDGLYNLMKFLDFKSGLELKFRKYEEIYLNIENQLKILEHIEGLEEYSEELVTLYNKYLLLGIFNDEEKIIKIMTSMNQCNHQLPKIKKPEQEDKSIQDYLAKSNFHDQYLQKYQSACQSLKKIAEKESQKERGQLFFQTFYTQAIIFAFFGEVKKSLKKLIEIFTISSSSQEKEASFCLFYTILCYNSSNKSQKNQQLMRYLKDSNKMLDISRLNDNDIKVLSESLISPSTIEEILNEWFTQQKGYQITWREVNHRELYIFYKLVYLLAENYYMSGEKQQANSILQLLQQKHQKGITVNKQIQGIFTPNHNILLLIQYLQTIQYYDQKEYAKCVQIVSKIHKKFDQGDYFFDPKKIELDVIIRNMYKMAAMSDSHLKNEEKAEEWREIEQSYEAFMGISSKLQDREKQLDEEMPEMIPNYYKELSNKVRIPYYYMNIPLVEMYSFNWNDFYSA